MNRRVFYIDVGNMPKAEVEAFLNQVMQRKPRNQVVEFFAQFGWLWSGLH